jgi:peptidyl-dipeptidase Dcp
MKRLALILTCCGVVATPVLSTVSPFAAPSPLPSEAPPFHRITDADYQPGVDQGMAEQIVEMRKIANNPAAPTFDNTNATLERSGALLRRVSAASGAVNQTDTNSVRQAV